MKEAQGHLEDRDVGIVIRLGLPLDLAFVMDAIVGACGASGGRRGGETVHGACHACRLTVHALRSPPCCRAHRLSQRG
jgi:hypothetical protein